MNARLMDVYQDTDALLDAYSGSLCKKNTVLSELDLDEDQKRLAFRVMKVSRKQASSKAERLRRQLELEKVKMYEKMLGRHFKKGMVPESMLGSGQEGFNTVNLQVNPGNVSHHVANKIKGMSLANLGTS